MITQVAYSNSNCSDIWEMFLNENKKHTNIPLRLVVDKLPEHYDVNNAFIYSNNDPYYKVWVDALEKFGGDYFIYLQEDFILYDDVNEKKIDEYVSFLKNNPKYSFVRLLKSINFQNKRLSPTLYEVESSNVNVFAMQPTIWRTTDYIFLLNLVKGSEWWEYDDYRKEMIAMNIMGAYHYDDERKAGESHYDSNVYPYTATALVKGKWNISEYGIYLNKLIKDYNIEINKRGIV